MLLNWTKSLLSKYNIKPAKRLGQNFLISENILAKLIDSAQIKGGDVVLEVGAGMGTITVELAKRAKKVIAVEKDKTLIPILEQTIGDFKNVEVVVGDILKIESLKIVLKLEIENWKLVGNIPYYLTAPLIRKFLESENPPQSMTLMVQKEMAQRISAKPPDMSILSVSVQVYAKPEIISYVPRSSFWPQPEVDSAILRITQINTDVSTDVRRFFTVVKAGFSSPRKQLINNLSSGLNISREQTEQWLFSANIDPKRRAETLTVEEWKRLLEFKISNLKTI